MYDFLIPVTCKSQYFVTADGLKIFHLSVPFICSLSSSNEFHGLFMCAGKKYLINILVSLKLLPELEIMGFGYLAVA